MPNQTAVKAIGTVAENQSLFSNLTWKGTAILITLIVALTVIILVGLIRNRPLVKKSSSPLIKSFIITGLFLVVLLVVEGLDWWTFPNWVKIVMIFGLFFTLLFYFSNKDSRDSAKKMKRLNELGWEWVSDNLNAGPIKGELLGYPEETSIVLPNDRYGGKDADVLHMLLTTDLDGIQVYLAFGMDTETLLYKKIDPDTYQKYEVFGINPKNRYNYIQKHLVPNSTPRTIGGVTPAPTTAPQAQTS